MSFYVRNISGGDVILNDLGLTIPVAGSPDFSTFDMIAEDPKQIATSQDLVDEINAGNLIVLDPLDGVTPLSVAQSVEIVQVHNDPHYRIRGGTLNQLEDVNLDAAGSPIVLTNQVLQWNGSDAFEPTTPDDLIGDGSSAVLDILAGALVDGDDTTVVLGGGSPFTTIQVNVDDSFLRNDGDTLDSGTLTITDGAILSIAGAGPGSPGTSGSLIIGQDATATIETPTGGFTNNNDLVNKEYVDGLAAGLDPKESVRVATQPGDTVGTYTAASPCGPGDTITGFPGILDTVTLEVDDRVLVKDRIDAKENGIYVVSVVNATSPVTVDLVRADDQNGDPGSEVSAGNFTHVEQGSQNINTKWVTTGDGLLTLCVDDINWVLFSGPDTIIADVGLTRVANTISLDVGDLSTANTPVLTDTIAFHDVDGATQGVAGSKTYSTTFEDMFAEFNVAYNISGNGIVVRTGGSPDAYTAREIQVNGLGNLDGLAITNGDGIAGDPTIGLDIQNLPYVTAGSPLGVIDTSDRVAVWDQDQNRNVYYEVSDIAGALASTNSFATWAVGTGASGVNAVADSGTDTMTVNAGTAMTITVANDPESITWAVDTSQINLGDLGDVNYGSPLPQAGDILQYGGSPEGWMTVPASTLTFDVCTLSAGSTATLDVTDEIAVCDGGSTVRFSFSDLFDTLDVPNNVTGTGIIVKTSGSPSPDTYATLSIVESTNAGEEGAQVNNGDGLSGNIEIGVDINNLTDSADDLSTTDELIVYDGANNVSMNGQQVADGVADILNLGGLSVKPIGTSGSPSQFTLVLTDPERGKDLSIAEWNIHFSENNVGKNDWLEVGNAVDATNGWIVPMDGTIVRATAHTASGAGAAITKDIDLYIDGAKTTDGFISFTGTGEQEYIDITKNIDVAAGEKLRLRGDENNTSIQDIIVNVWIKWRAI